MKLYRTLSKTKVGSDNLAKDVTHIELSKHVNKKVKGKIPNENNTQLFFL